MKDEHPIQLKLDWNRTSTAYFTSLLFTQVKNVGIEFNLEVKKGSILSVFAIGFASELASGATLELIKGLLRAAVTNAKKRGTRLKKPFLEYKGSVIETETIFKDYYPDHVNERIERKRELVDMSRTFRIREYIKSVDQKELLEIRNAVEYELRTR